MESVVAAVLGVLLGAGLTEFFRRKSRVETFSQALFDRRLRVYEGLYERLNQAYEVGIELSKQADLSPEERHAIWSDQFLGFANFCDRHGLYLDERVVIHCSTMMIGIDEIAAHVAESERQARREDFSRDYLQAKTMIKEVSGVARIERDYQSITRAVPKSKYIAYFHSLKEQRARGRG